MHAGEFTSGMVAPTLVRIIDESRATLKRAADKHEPERRDPRALRYPGKVAVRGKELAIADSGNDRVIIAELNDAGARITRVLGGGRGYRDGAEPLFDHPQGVAFDGESLLVADAFNHAIREVVVATGSTRTIAGTGKQLRT